MDWIERIAREHGTGGWQSLDDMVKFGKAIAEAERESCAQACESNDMSWADDVWNNAVMDCATKIRARSNGELTGRGAVPRSG